MELAISFSRATHVGPVIRLIQFGLKINSSGTSSLNALRDRDFEDSASERDQVKVTFLNPIGNVGSLDTSAGPSGDVTSFVYLSNSSVFVRKSLSRSNETFPVPS